MMERDLEVRINRNANRRHAIYRQLEDPLIGASERDRLGAELAGLELDSESLFRELRIARARESHTTAVQARSRKPWPIVPMTAEPAENVTPVEVVERRRRMRRSPVSRPTIG